MTDTIDVVREVICKKHRYVRLDEFFAIEENELTSAFKLPDVLDSVKKVGGLPLDFYDEDYRYYCENCGSRTVKAGHRDNKRGNAQRYMCKSCRKYFTFGFNRHSHLRKWVYDTILFSVVEGDRSTRMAKQVKRDGKKLKLDVKISGGTINNVIKRSSMLLDELEQFALQKLVPEPEFRVWIIDDRYHSQPKKRSRYVQKQVCNHADGREDRLEEEERREKEDFEGKMKKKRRKRRKKKHWYVTCVLDEATGYCLSSCISRRRNLEASLRALITANKRVRCEPEVVKCDKHGPHGKAAKILFPKAKVLAKSKKSKEGFPWINKIENWFSGASRAIPKRGRFRSLNTLEYAFNIYRHSRNLMEPYRKCGKTPAELVGIVLPVWSRTERDWVKLLDFADRLINFAKAEEKRKVRDLFRLRGIRGFQDEVDPGALLGRDSRCLSRR